MAITLRCDSCGKTYLSVFLAEKHSSKTRHVDFVDITREEDTVALGEPTTLTTPGQEAGARTLRGDMSRPLPTPTMIEEEVEERQKRVQESRLRLRKENESQDQELVRIRRNIKMDWARRKQNSSPAAPSPSAAAAASPPPPELAKTNRLAATPTQTRLKLRMLDDGSILVKMFPVEAKLSEVAETVRRELGLTVASFTQPDTPRKAWGEAEFDVTLQQAQLVPSAALIVKQKVTTTMPNGQAGFAGAMEA